MGCCLPLHCTPHAPSLTSALSLVNRKVSTQAQIKFPPSLFSISTFLPLWPHVLYFQLFWFLDIVQLKTSINGKLLAYFCVFLFVKTQHAVLGLLFSLNTSLPRV